MHERTPTSTSDYEFGVSVMKRRLFSLYLRYCLRTFGTVRCKKLFEISFAIQFAILFDKTTLDQIRGAFRAREMIHTITTADGRYVRTSAKHRKVRKTNVIVEQRPYRDATCMALRCLISIFVSIQRSTAFAAFH